MCLTLSDPTPDQGELSMATKKTLAAGSAKKPTGTQANAKAAARHTGSAPSKVKGADDELAQHAKDVQDLVAGMPYNKTKAQEHGRENAGAPPMGATVEPKNPGVTGSTLSERNEDTKAGAPPAPGASPTTGNLDRVRTDNSGQRLTTNQGVGVSDNQNSLKAGLRGPTLLEDFVLREKITHFDHERIPERIVHARGSGAHGYFENYKPLAKYTRAAPFKEAGKITPVFVRFSTVAGERGSTDTARDVRGFAVKFYTDEGNWDLVGNNIPVFFIQDAMKFPDLIHAVKPEPHHGMPQAASAHDTFWDFISLMPESTHMMM
jgi:catalase